MESFNALKNLVLEAEKDAERFYVKGNKSAGTRVRAHMQEIIKQARTIRKEVSELKTKMVAEKKTAVVA